MNRARPLATVVALSIGALLALVAAPHDPSASAAGSRSRSAGTHRAAVVVDLGDGQVKVGCVSFTEDHISGLDALDRASMAPVAQTFGGQGGAVCALCGKGCSAGSTCLTCKAPNYWAYYHDGTYSPVGASQSQVRDGDIEGWKWGKGEQPANVRFDQVCLPLSVTTSTPSPTTKPVGPGATTTPLTSPPPTSTGQQSGNGPGGSTIPTGTSPSEISGTSVVGPTTATTAVPVASTTSTAAPAISAVPKARTGPKGTIPRAGQNTPANGGGTAIGGKHVVIERAGTRTGSSLAGSGGTGSSSQTSAWSIAAFAGAIAVVAGLIVVFRRRRATGG